MKVRQFIVNNKEIIVRSIFVFLVLAITVFGLTFAWYSFTNPDIDVAGNTSSWCDGLDVTASGGTITNANLGSPKDAYNSNGATANTTFSITNNENSAVGVDISITNITMDSALKNEYFMYTLTDGSNVISEGNFNSVSSVSGGFIVIKQNLSLPASTTKNYSLYLWIKNNGGNQNDMQNKTFSGNMKMNFSSSFCNVRNGTGSLEFVNRQNANSITVGDELAIDTEHFYVVSSNSTETVLLSKYSLYVGDIYDVNGSNVTLNKTLSSSDIGYGLQNNTVRGWISGTGSKQYVGVVAFSGTNYWDNSVCNSSGSNYQCTGTSGLLNTYSGSYQGNPYPNVYNENLCNVIPEYNYDNGFGYAQNNGYTIAYYVNEYLNKLKTLGLSNIRGRLLSTEEANSLGCSFSTGMCNNNQSWVYSSTYWLSSAFDGDNLWFIDSNGHIFTEDAGFFYISDLNSVRPVIVVPTSSIS